MVQYKGRPQSENIKRGNTTFEDNKQVVGRSNVGLPDKIIDPKRIAAEVSFKQTNRMMNDPYLLDMRYDEYYGGYGGSDVTVVPKEFMLDTFKRARQAGLKMPWNEFRKTK